MGITARLPAALSARISSTANAITARAGRRIDYAIGGIPFLSAASPDNPFIIQTADMKKEQQDQEPEPGEQSLSGWWLRSQDSWHEGAGDKYQEARGTVKPSNKFFSSQGVDVWTEGQLTLLKNTVQSTATSSEAVCLFATSSNLYLGVGTDVRQTTLGSGSATTSLATTGGNVQDLTVGQEAWYAVSDDGKVYTKPISGGSLKNFPLTNADSTFYTTNRVCWAKHRLFATRGRKVYVVDTSQASTTAMAAFYSHPTTDWSYTDISEGPSCVYLAGWSEQESCIQKVILNDDGSIPTLSAGVTAAIFPKGEKVQRISVLAGTWIGIATSKGFRVGAIDVNGDIQYGPLFVQPTGCVEAKALHADGRFWYVSWMTTDSAARVYRIDSSRQPDNDGAFSWAADAEISATGYFNDLVVIDGRVVGAFFAGTYPSFAAAKYQYQHATDLVATASITFGRIRFRTTELKLYKYLAIDADPLAGTITATAVLPTDTVATLGTFSTPGQSEFDQLQFSTNLGPQRSMGLTFAFTRSGTDSTKGPKLRSYTVKAVPATKPQRLIQLPLSCYDMEVWSTGQLDGAEGWAKDRIDALQAIEDGGDLTLWQDFSTEDASGRQVKIESVRFLQDAPPHSALLDRNYGGIIQLVLRTMD